MPDADWWQVMWPHPEKVLVEMGVRPLAAAPGNRNQHTFPRFSRRKPGPIPPPLGTSWGDRNALPAGMGSCRGTIGPAFAAEGYKLENDVACCARDAQTPRPT